MTCSCCEKVWATVQEFLGDPDVKFIGLGMGVSWYNHETPDCGTTLVLPRSRRRAQNANDQR